MCVLVGVVYVVVMRIDGKNTPPNDSGKGRLYRKLDLGLLNVPVNLFLSILFFLLKVEKLDAQMTVAAYTRSCPKA